MTEQRARLWLLVIVLAYLLVGFIYSTTTPPFEASDELWHYPMVKYLADNGLQLPPQDPSVPTAWRQEGSQPPLYYMLAAVLTSWIDTSDLDYWRRINPHADIGVILPDGNVNMIVHRPNEGENRSIGALSALQISRTLSLVLGAGTIIVTWLLGRALFPQTPIIAVIASALNGFLPMFLFISGSVNNDNLSNLLGNLLTLLVVRLLIQTSAPSLQQYVILGILMGGGLLAKLSLGFFIPIIALSLLIISLRRRDWRPLMIGGIISGALTIVTAGWWYLRNWQLYGDPTGLNVFLDIVGRRTIPANTVQLWSERDSYLRAFWGFFGGVNVPMPETVYDIFNILGFFGMFSAIIFVVVYVARRQQQTMPIWNTSIGLPHALTILWIVVTFVSYLRWTAETPASQGRLVFVALSSICVWLAVGWCWWLPRRAAGLAALPVVWTGIAALFAPLTIADAYRTPYESDVPFPPIEYYDFVAPEGGSIRIGASPITPSVQPDQYVRLNVYFVTQASFQRDWSIFVHLVNQDGVIIGQRDVYPGRGTLATSDLIVSDAWNNDIAIRIPPHAYAPQTLDVIVGWYHLPTGERMITDSRSETVTVSQLDLQPRTSELAVPNPISINFSDQIELVGYSLSDLSPMAGSEATLTLYWRGLRDLDTDYVVFAQIIDPLTTTIYAASDAMPAQWSAPTSTWEPGVIIEDAHTLAVNPTAPPGIYEIYVGLYTRGADGSFNRLRVFMLDGGAAFDYTQLTRVRILPSVSP